ncbi:MAG: nucleoside 2-deoxyribosyltransferase [Candidatus Saccharimonadales bacterium]
MKLFCAYAFTGEDIAVLTERMRLVVDTLESNGHTAYCNRFDPIVDELQAANDIKGIFQEAFKNIQQSEAVVAVIASPNRSIGQIMEIGVALSQSKPVYLLEHISAEGSTYLPRLVHNYQQWRTTEDLKTALLKI